jgi:hypothetical protein
MIRSRITGKRVFGMGVMLTLLTAAIFWQINVREGQAQSGGGFGGAILVLNNATLTTIASGAAGTQLNASLTASTQDGDDAGTVRIWGVKQGDTIATVNMHFELNAFNGTIEAQGVLTNVVTEALTGDDVLAITGGTGTFRGANGEVVIQRKSDGTVVVRLKETPRR